MTTTAIRNTSATFMFGMEQGKRRVFRENLNVPGGELGFPPGEEGVIEVIQNLIYAAKDGSLTEELLHQDVGRVIGYAITHPMPFRTDFS